MKKIVFLFLSALLLFVSCASTDISSYTNSEKNIAKYNKILVTVNSRDIGSVKTLEENIVKSFSNTGVMAIPKSDILSPLKEYSQSEINQLLMKNNIDGILSVTIASASKETDYIPQQSYTTYTTQYSNGMLVSVPNTTTYGGYTSTSLLYSFDVILEDAISGDIIIKATANSDGDFFSAISNSLSSSVKNEVMMKRNNDLCELFQNKIQQIDSSVMITRSKNRIKFSNSKELYYIDVKPEVVLITLKSGLGKIDDPKGIIQTDSDNGSIKQTINLYNVSQFSDVMMIIEQIHNKN